MQTITTDLLVIGSGLAGLTAAIRGRETAPSLEVTLCSKSPPGLANNTAVSQGFFLGGDPALPPATQREKTLAAGYRLNDPAMVEAMTAAVADALDQLSAYGVPLNEGSGGWRTTASKHGSVGAAIVRPLVNKARDLGVRFRPGFFAWELLKEGGRVHGAWGFQGPEMTPLAVQAGAVVLATGGGGALFARSDNPPGMSGDGYALAYRAGLPLIDLEFVQFYPLGTAFPGEKSRFLPVIFADAGTFRNASGEDVLIKHGITAARPAATARDLLSRALVLEVQNGLGVEGAVRLDLGDSNSSWEQAAQSFGLTDPAPYKAMARKLARGKNYLPVMPLCHFFCGGVPTGPEGETDLEGLFAAGEVTGGLHGANRLGGNALSEALVFGLRAGKAAALAAGHKKKAPRKEQEAAGDTALLGQLESSKEPPPVDALRARLATVMWEKAGILRSEESLKSAQKEIAAIEEALAGGGAPADRRAWLELKNLLLTASLVSASARLRRESRGSHYRLDYPRSEERWNRNITQGRCFD